MNAVAVGTHTVLGGALRRVRTPRWSLNTGALFYAVLLLVMAFYTYTAFQMDWMTDGGRIGPGFFPRIIGVLAAVISLAAVVKSLRRPVEDMHQGEDSGTSAARHHPAAMTLLVLAGFVAFVLVLSTLGAIPTSAIFLFAMLSYFNRGRWVANTVLSVVSAVCLYLLFQTLLNAGLPAGILPGF